MKQNDEIEDLFQSAFEDFSVAPPPDVKALIDNRLANTHKFRYRWIFLSTLILLVSAGGFFLYMNSTNTLFSRKTSAVSETPSPTPFNEPVSNVSQEETNIQTEKPGTQKETTSTSGSTLPFSSNEEKTRVQKTTDNHGSKPTASSVAAAGKTTAETSVSGTKKSAVSHPLVVKNTASKSNRKNKKSRNTSAVSSSATKHTTKSGSLPSNGNSSEKAMTSGPGKITPEATKGITSPDEITSSSEEKTLLADEKTNSGSKHENTTASDSVKTQGNLAATADSVSQKDSTAQVNNTPPIVNPEKNPATYTWLLSLHSGSSIVSNSFSSESFSTQESNRFFINAEASYLYNDKSSVSSGIQYNQFSNILSFKGIQIDSIYDGIDSMIVINPADSTDSTVYFEKYSYSEKDTVFQQQYSHSSISIPLYFGYTHKINDKWFFDAHGGILLSYQQAKRMDSNPKFPAPTIHTFGMKVCLRPQLRYQFGDFGVSISTNLGYDLLPGLKWDGVSWTRIYSELGIGVHYSF